MEFLIEVGSPSGIRTHQPGPARLVDRKPTVHCLIHLELCDELSKINQEKVAQAISEGRTHLNFVVSLYQKQMMRGKHFLHEHPTTALPWKEYTVAALVKSPLVHSVVADQYVYGLTTPSEDDLEKHLPAMKPTRFMTNSSHMQACSPSDTTATMHTSHLWVADVETRPSILCLSSKLS